MPRFRIHQLVEFEFGEVRAWYAGHSPLAAENFVHFFHLALDKVEKHPTAHAPWRPPFRRIRLQSYPYLLIYHSDRATTTVLALAHEKRDARRVTKLISERLVAIG